MSRWVIGLLFGASLALGATVNGPRAPDGTEIQCDLPGSLHRKNTQSQGQGCCVWTSIHHAAHWQNVPAYQEAPRWIQEHGIPGGAHPGAVAEHLPKMAQERGTGSPPAFINYEGYDLTLLQLACKTGRMPAVTYCVSPSGRYGGQRIAHMVNVVHCDSKWVAILDNNYIGEQQIEWLTVDEFRPSWTGMGGGWAVILLAPPPPPVPHR